MTECLTNAAVNRFVLLALLISAPTVHADPPSTPPAAFSLKVDYRAKEQLIWDRLKTINARPSRNSEGQISVIYWKSDQPARLKLLRSLSGLERLYLDDSDVMDKDLKKISALPIRVLNLSGTSVTDRGIKHLKSMSNMSALVLTNTSVTDKGLKVITENFGNLDFLYLSNTKVTDKAIANIIKLERLKTLYLNGTQVSDDSLPALRTLEQLHTLYVHQTNISDDGKAKLRKWFPKANIKM